MNSEAEQKLNERIDMLAQQVQMLANTVSLLSKMVTEAPQKPSEPHAELRRYPTTFPPWSRLNTPCGFIELG